jgi:hypothetical protein
MRLIAGDFWLGTIRPRVHVDVPLPSYPRPARCERHVAPDQVWPVCMLNRTPAKILFEFEVRYTLCELFWQRLRDSSKCVVDVVVVGELSV